MILKQEVISLTIVEYHHDRPAFGIIDNSMQVVNAVAFVNFEKVRAT